MSVFEHQRWEVWGPLQHPYKHAISEFYFSHPAFGDEVTNLEGALNWILAVLYPNMQTSVANQAALPLVGNTINDMRVVEDDGDGKAATYRWEQREGEASASWHKIYDMDWGYDSILSGTLDKTQDLYVKRQGYDDLDEDGVALTGVDAGQHIYGGLSASTHLTLHANSGDGVGAQTGYIQAADNVRPTNDSTLSLGTTAERWLKVWADEITSSTMTILGGSITDSSGAISFDNENLTTTGNISGAIITGSTSGVFGAAGDMTIAAGSITSASGAISFGNENLTTTGTFAALSATIGTMSIAGGSITDSSGSISFDNENLVTTGTLGAGAITGTQLNIDNLRLDGNTLSVTNTDGSLTVSANGTGVVAITSAMTTIGQTVTGTVAITGQLDVDNLRLNGSQIRSITAADIEILPTGGGSRVLLGRDTVPDGDNIFDLGTSTERWETLYLGTGIHDGTTSISSATIQSLRDINSGVGSGYSLFWNGSKWVASLPDTEVDHGTITGLGDDDHTQYALLAGRSGGQSITGGTAASNNLTLDSTSNGTKGSILLGSNTAPTSDNTRDLGSASAYWKDFYVKGELKGARLENYTTAGRPAASAGTPGRVIFDTDLKDVFFDVGGSWRQMSVQKVEVSDASGWTGSVATVSYDVSAYNVDARLMRWCLKDNSNSYQEMGGDITHTSSTNVTVTFGANAPAGTYTLIGVG